MGSRILLTFLFLVLWIPDPAAAQPPAGKSRIDPLDGPPFVSAKSWMVIDAKAGKKLAGDHEADPRPMASTTKIMTAWLVPHSAP